jgi:hypothetical protein
MNRLVLIACRRDRAKDWMHRSGLTQKDVLIVTKPRQLQGLTGIRKDPECGMFAIYVEDWWRGSGEEEALLLEMLRGRGFNGPFKGG